MSQEKEPKSPSGIRFSEEQNKLLMKEFHQMSCRYPIDVYNQIQQRAHENWRSFNAELVVILYEYFSRPKIDYVVEEVSQIKLVVEAINYKLGGVSKK